jgi:hypothetical protein
MKETKSTTLRLRTFSFKIVYSVKYKYKIQNYEVQRIASVVAYLSWYGCLRGCKHIKVMSSNLENIHIFFIFITYHSRIDVGFRHDSDVVIYGS